MSPAVRLDRLLSRVEARVSMAAAVESAATQRSIERLAALRRRVEQAGARP